MVSEARSSVLASQALATDPFQRFLQARPARKLRLTDRRMLFRRDPDFVDAPAETVKQPEMTVFDSDSLQCVFWQAF